MATEPLTHLSLLQSYEFCEALAKNHYENFPVASFFLPRKIRRAIMVIYAFARKADDISDEGTLAPEERLAALNHYWKSLDQIIQSKEMVVTDPILMALQDVLQQYPQLPTELLFDLLRAFKQDVTQNTYQNFEEILAYCHYSAHPIGRLLLWLTDNATVQNLQDSDRICEALQLLNFLQDLLSDICDRNRCYLPQDEMFTMGVTVDDLKQQSITPEIQHLIAHQLKRAKTLLNNGAALGARLPGLFGFEIRLIIQGGLAIAKKLEQRKTPYIRPILKWYEILMLFLKAFIN